MRQTVLRRHAFVTASAYIGSEAAERFITEAWPIGDEEKKAAETAENFRERMLRLTEEVLKKEREKGTVFAQA